MFASGLPTPEEGNGDASYPHYNDTAGTGDSVNGGVGDTQNARNQGGVTNQGLGQAGHAHSAQQRDYWTPNAIGGGQGGGANGGVGAGAGRGGPVDGQGASGAGHGPYDHQGLYGQGYPASGPSRSYDYGGLSSQRMQANSTTSKQEEMTMNTSYNTSSYNVQQHHQQQHHQHHQSSQNHRSDLSHRSLAPFSALESSSTSSSSPFLPRISDIPPSNFSSQHPSHSGPPQSYDPHHGFPPSSTPSAPAGGDNSGVLPSMFSIFHSSSGNDNPGQPQIPGGPQHMIDPALMGRTGGEYAYPVPVPYGSQAGYQPDMSVQPMSAPADKGSYGRHMTHPSFGDRSHFGQEQVPPQSAYPDGSHVLSYAPSEGGPPSSSAASHMSFLDRQVQPPLLSPHETGPSGHQGYPMYQPGMPMGMPGSMGERRGVQKPGGQQQPYQRPAAKRKRGYSSTIPHGVPPRPGEVGGGSQPGRREDIANEDPRQARGGSKPPQPQGQLSPSFSSKPKFNDTGLPRLHSLLSAPGPERQDSHPHKQSPGGYPAGNITMDVGLGPSQTSGPPKRSLNVTQVTGSYAVPQRSREQETGRLLAGLRDTLPTARAPISAHYFQSIEAVQNELAGLQATLREGLANLVANTSPTVWIQAESGQTTLNSVQSLVNASRAVLDVMTSLSAREPSEPWRSPYSQDPTTLHTSVIPSNLFPQYSPDVLPLQSRHSAFTFPDTSFKEEIRPREVVGLPRLADMAISPALRSNETLPQEILYGGLPPVPMLEPAPASRVPPPEWQRPETIEPAAINPEALVQPKPEERAMLPIVAPPVTTRSNNSTREPFTRPRPKDATSSITSGKIVAIAGTATGQPMKPKRVSHSPWTPEEAVKLAELAEDSKGRQPGMDPMEVDWDFVVNGFKGSRSRHQVLIKAVYLGVKPTTTHASRLVRQKQYKGKESELGLSPEKIKRYLSLGGKGEEEEEDDGGDYSDGE